MSLAHARRRRSRGKVLDQFRQVVRWSSVHPLESKPLAHQWRVVYNDVMRVEMASSVLREMGLNPLEYARGMLGRAYDRPRSKRSTPGLLRKGRKPFRAKRRVP